MLFKKAKKNEPKQELVQNDWLFVNIWTSNKNRAIPGNNVGHVSLESRHGYISLWPYGKKEHSFTPILDEYFGIRPKDFKQDYDTDCVLEAISEGHRMLISNPVVDIPNAQNRGYKLFINDTRLHTFTRIEYIPKTLGINEHLIAADPCNATIRIVLYGVNVGQVQNEFEKLRDSITGWKKVGSNVIVRVLEDETAENCSSFVYRCLCAGGMYSNLKSGVCCQTSSVVTPDTLVRHVIAAKERELEECPKTATWQHPGESNLQYVKNAYANVGQDANAENDLFTKYCKC